MENNSPFDVRFNVNNKDIYFNALPVQTITVNLITTKTTFDITKLKAVTFPQYATAVDLYANIRT